MVSTSYKDDQPDLSEALASWDDWNYDFWITAIELDDPLRISRPSQSSGKPLICFSLLFHAFQGG